MKELYKDFLFEKHVLVSSEDQQGSVRDAFSVIVALGRKFGIRITDHSELATVSMIHDAARCLGEHVPEPFYLGFPESVRELPPDRLLFDQLVHYTMSYGMGWWDNPGYSIMEGPVKDLERVIYDEHVEPKSFEILTEENALHMLKEELMLLLSSNRPLNENRMMLITEAWKDFGHDILPEWIPCKATVIQLLYTFKDSSFCKYLKLSDVMKLLNYIQYTQYHSENLKKLNLKNQDRKLITFVINELIWLDLYSSNKTYCDYTVCFEKRKLWCGLFHHIHYHPPVNCGLMGKFVNDVRSNKNFSAYSYFEKNMKNRNFSAAVSHLANKNGTSELIRHLNYILSRCETEEEVKEVLAWLK